MLAFKLLTVKGRVMHKNRLTNEEQYLMIPYGTTHTNMRLLTI